MALGEILKPTFLREDRMIELRNAISIYSELTPYFDMVVLVSDDDIDRTKEILEQAYDNWFNLELNPEIQSIAIGDYLTDELNKAGIYYKDF